MRSAQGTLLHTRRFLAYHGSRFSDQSLILRDEKAQIVGLFPAALEAGDQGRICSHPGATYGGLIFESDTSPGEVLEMMRAITRWCAEAGHRTLQIRMVPWHVRKSPCDSDLYALWRIGAHLARRDLWNVIDLLQPRRVREGHRWSMRQAVRWDVTVSREEPATCDEFHRMLASSLDSRHQVRPVHSREELEDLHTRLGDAVQLWGGRDRHGRLVAGAWLLKLHPGCWHTQYLTVSEEGRRCGALHLLVEHMIGEASAAGIHYFSFGASTSGAEAELNQSLQQFKAGFGHGVACQEAYLIDLANLILH